MRGRMGALLPFAETQGAPTAGSMGRKSRKSASMPPKRSQPLVPPSPGAGEELAVITEESAASSRTSSTSGRPAPALLDALDRKLEQDVEHALLTAAAESMSRIDAALDFSEDEGDEASEAAAAAAPAPEGCPSSEAVVERARESVVPSPQAMAALEEVARLRAVLSKREAALSATAAKLASQGEALAAQGEAAADEVSRLREALEARDAEIRATKERARAAAEDRDKRESEDRRLAALEAEVERKRALEAAKDRDYAALEAKTQSAMAALEAKLAASEASAKQANSAAVESLRRRLVDAETANATLSSAAASATAEADAAAAAAIAARDDRLRDLELQIKHLDDELEFTHMLCAHTAPPPPPRPSVAMKKTKKPKGGFGLFRCGLDD